MAIAISAEPTGGRVGGGCVYQWSVSGRVCAVDAIWAASRWLAVTYLSLVATTPLWLYESVTHYKHSDIQSVTQ